MRTRTVVYTATTMAISRNHSPKNPTVSMAPEALEFRTMQTGSSLSARQSSLATKQCSFPPASKIGSSLPSQIQAIGVEPLLSTSNSTVYPNFANVSSFYINPPGVGCEEACIWGTKSDPIGNWSPYVAGANTDGNGETFIKLGWNPIYLEPATPFRDEMPTWGVEVVCEADGCNGLPCAKSERA